MMIETTYEALLTFSRLKGLLYLQVHTLPFLGLPTLLAIYIYRILSIKPCVQRKGSSTIL